MRIHAALITVVSAVAFGGVPAVSGASGLGTGNVSSPELTTRELLSLVSIGGYSGTLSVSPDGRSVAFQLQRADYGADTYRSEWYVAPIVPGAKPVPVGSGGDLMLTPSPFGRTDGARADVQAEWSPDSRWIAYLRKDGDEIQVWRSRADGSRTERVTDSGANVLDFAWSADGRAIYFHVGRNRAVRAREDRIEGEHGYLVDDRFIPEESTKPLWAPCGSTLWNTPVVKSERCTPRLWIETFGSPEHAATAAEASAYRRLSTLRRPPGVAGTRAIRQVSWNSTGTQVAWLENLSPRMEPGPVAPVTLFADGRPCRAAACSGQLRRLWWRGNAVVFQRSEGWAYSVPALYLWRPQTGMVRLLYRLDSALKSCAMALDRLVCLQETPESPRKIVSIRMSDGRVDTVFDPNPGFSRYRLGRVEKLDVSDGMGNNAFGHLVYPPDFKMGCRYPLVIVQYRSEGFLSGGVGNEFPIFPLAAAGFLVYSSDNPFDWRLAARYDVSHWQGLAAVTGRQIGPTAYRQRSALAVFDAVIDRLTKRGILDPSRVGITGLSAGAAVVNYALIHSKRFAAAATSGMPSPGLGYFEVNRTMRANFEAAMDAHTIADAIRKGNRVLSLAYNVSRVDTPLLMQVPDVELIGDTPAYVALADAGKPVEAYVFPGEYHVKWRPLHKLAVGDRAIDWFRFWLEGEENSSPAKASQYARWRVLRREAHYPSLAEDRWSCPRGIAPRSDPNLGGNAREERR